MKTNKSLYLTISSERISENETDSLFNIIWSSAFSKMLEVALDLQLFEYLAVSARSLEEISTYFKLPISSSRVLLQYLCGMRLLELRKGKFLATSLGNKLLLDGEIVSQLKELSVRLSAWDFGTLLRSPRKQPWYELRKGASDLSRVERISKEFFTSRSRHQWRVEKGCELAENYDFTLHKCLLDVGGASGGWSSGIASVYSHLVCIVYDLPQVCEYGSEMIENDIDRQIVFKSGNMFTDPFASGADVVLFANVLHDWSRNDMVTILEKVHSYLPINGVVLVWEFFLNDQWNGPLGSLHHGITVLGPDGESGEQPSYLEMSELLNISGFKKVEQRNNLLIGIKS